jgi:PKD repeat protein
MPVRSSDMGSRMRHRVVGLALLVVLGGLVGAAPAPAAPPLPSFTISAGEVHVGETVTFTSTATDPDGDTLTATWDFTGDGAPDAAGAAVSFAFGAAGTATVTLTVADMAGESASTSRALAVLEPAPPSLPAPPPAPPPPAANAPPMAAFTFAPSAPAVGQTVTFNSTSADGDGAIVLESWDLDGDGQFDEASGPSVTWAFGSFGTRTIRLRVRDDAGGEATVTRTISVNQPPAAAFSAAPAVVIAGQAATFVSTSTDADGSIARLEWSLDGDERFDDGGAATVARTYATPGAVVVRLRATDDRGATSVAAVIVDVVADRPPLASFSFSPTVPVAGEPATFVSTSSDPDGSLTALTWDLDGDGNFEDAAGSSVVRTFRTSGSFVVALRATDDRGASSIAFQTVVVREPASLHDAEAASQPGSSAPNSNPPGSASRTGKTMPARRAGRAAPVAMSPFPVVRIRGRALGSRVTVNLLSIRAPRGATVTVRCRGKGCPRRTASVRGVSTSRSVRLRSLERVYRAGAVLEVYVTKAGRVGKYVRFRIRNGAAPARHDGCLSARGLRKIRCPGS